MKYSTGKSAFITGGSSGIGLGIARAFLDAGMKVAITYRTPAHLDEAMQYLAAAGDRLLAIRMDVANGEEVAHAADEAMRTFGRLHVLVNNAGAQLPASFSNTSEGDWDRIMAVNVTGVFNGIRAFLPHIQDHGEGGHIVATASILGLLAAGGYGAYCASKFAVVGLMEVLRAELTDTNIGVSVLCPGWVKSNLEPWLKDHPQASDPLEIGQLVLRGMEMNDLYILTHPELTPYVALRQEALSASAPRHKQVGPEVMAQVEADLQKSIYHQELARLREAHRASVDE